MIKWGCRGVAAAAILVAGFNLHAQDMGGMAPAAEAAPAEDQAEERPIRLVQPWRRMESLSDEQKQQIQEVHHAALAEIRAIRQREREQIMALLSDEQKGELETILNRDRPERSTQEPADSTDESANTPAPTEGAGM